MIYYVHGQQGLELQPLQPFILIVERLQLHLEIHIGLAMLKPVWTDCYMIILLFFVLLNVCLLHVFIFFFNLKLVSVMKFSIFGDEM